MLYGVEVYPMFRSHFPSLECEIHLVRKLQPVYSSCLVHHQCRLRKSPVSKAEDGLSVLCARVLPRFHVVLYCNARDLPIRIEWSKKQSCLLTSPTGIAWVTSRATAAESATLSAHQQKSFVVSEYRVFLLWERKLSPSTHLPQRILG